MVNIMNDKNNYIEVGDLIVFRTNLLGKLVYKIEVDSLNVKLVSINKDRHEYHQVFRSLYDLEQFVLDESNNAESISLSS